MALADLFSRLEILKQKLLDEIKKLNQTPTSQIGIGRVLRSGVGTYDLLVDIAGRGPTACLMASASNGAPFGVADVDLPIDGSYVLVVTGADTSDIGYVVGVVDTPGAEDDPEDLKTLPQLVTSFEKGSPGVTTERIYSESISGNKVNGIDVGTGKLGDVFPGEFVRLNEFGVGVDCDTLSARVRGGSAQVSASFVDNAVEIVSRNFRQYSGGGNTSLVVDNGLVTRESSFSPYFGERRGGAGKKAPKKPLKKEDTGGGDGPGSNETEEDGSRPVGKFRLRTYEGYIGGAFSSFLSKPDKCTEDVSDASKLRTTADTEPKDVGLMQLNINDNGRLMYRSAGGVVLERTDFIPVPERIREQGDPDGMKSEDVKYEDTLAFEIPEDGDGNKSPHYAILALADKQAYEYRQTYERFLELIKDSDSSDSEGSGEGGEDGSGSNFYLRNEEDLFDDDSPVTDDAGIPDRKVAPDELEYNVGRRSSLLMPPDGSVILRDAWGSEIIMSGGNITINTPGNIIMAPGRSSICMAGDDVVVKARSSIDVISTERDITVNGNRAVKIIGGSDQAPDAGGVLIESFSKDSTVKVSDDDDGENDGGIEGEDFDGENAVFTGIILKAAESHITAMGKKAVFGAASELRIATGKGSEDEREGRVVVSTSQFGVAAKDGMTLSSEEGGLIVTGGNIVLAGTSAAIAAQDGVMFATKTQVGMPVWLDFKFDMASSYVSFMESYCKQQQRDSLNEPLPLHDYVEETLFTYRTSEQCNTLKGLELTDPAENFTLYQPFWTIMADLEIGTLEKTKTTTWEEHTIGGDYPWPGTDAMSKGKYAKLDREDGEPPKNLKVVELRGKNRNGEDELKRVLCSEKFDNIVNSKDEEGNGQIKVALVELDEYVVPDLQSEDEDED